VNTTSPTAVRDAQTWWARPDLRYDDEGVLWFGGERATALARRAGTPAYFYSADRITANVLRLRRALAQIGPRPPRLLYAMKSNRFAPVLMHLRELGVGLDVCSPGEVRHALASGYQARELSFTAGALSTADYAALAGWPEVWVNADSLTALRRLAQVSPGRAVGLRINPATGLGYRANPLVQYAGRKPTKFGVYLDRFTEAVQLARELGLELTTLHCHAGCGFLTPQLPALAEVFARIATFLEAAPQIRRLNLGGGLGIPLAADDQPLDLDAWAGLVQRAFGSRGLELELEPGDYLVKDAGILLTEVTQVEAKGGRTFVGLNAGFNVHPEPAFYGLPLAPAPAQRRPGALAPVTLVGNINEALDVWADEVALPPLAEGDVLCLLNAGGYGASMGSAHCLRTEVTEHFLAATGVLPPAGPDALARSNQKAWDQLYRSTDDLVWGGEPLPFLATLREDFRTGLSHPARLLDAGTGEGRNLPALLACGAEEVHALDSSARALEKMPEELRRQVHCRQADLSATGYPDAHFDGIVILDVIETLPNVEPVLRELARVLKPGGMLLCNIPGLEDGVAGIDMQAIGQNSFLYRDTYYFQFIERHEAEALLQRAGLEVLRSSRCQWREQRHPGFRQEEHGHVSQILLARKPPPPASALPAPA
jgi:diaminopimelate decarboxylase